MSVTETKSGMTAFERYVFLATGLVVTASLSLLNTGENPYSFIRRGEAGGTAAEVLLWVLAACCLPALMAKIARGDRYRTSVMSDKRVRTAGRAVFFTSLAMLILLFIDRAVLGIIHTFRVCAGMETNPQPFGESMVYMTVKGWSMLSTGIWTTVRIALFGTAIAFVLAVFMVFLRILEPQKRDRDIVKALKWLASGFTKLYIFVIRGTPMMVQTLIFYYFGFDLFKKTGMSVTEINNVWSFFISGLFTVSLNSTAYLTEVLRGGINAVDPGQTEAARSLGMSSWQAMLKVVFPQAVRNSIPAIGNEFIINIKDSSVLSVIGVMDLMYATKSVSGIYYRSLEIYCVAAIVYLVLTWLASALLNRIGRRLDVPVRGIPSSN